MTMFETSNPKQPFFIANRVDLFPDDLRVLVKLYQPLIGSLAFSLYLSLNEDFTAHAMLSDSTGIYNLQEQLDCDVKHLDSALHKLEGVGLIKTCLLNNEIMGQVLVFRLTCIPSSSEFFATPLLASLLKEKVGITAFQKLSKDFARESKAKQNQVNGMQNAKDISASFMEVFRLPEEEAIEPSADVKYAAKENKINNNVKATINEQDAIDWDFMKQQFEIYQIPETEIDQNREAIRSIMRTYGLTEQEFVDESLSSIHGDYHLNISHIKQAIASSIHGNHTRARIKQETQTKVTNQKANFKMSPQEQKILQLAQSKSPAQFLYQLKTDRHDYVDASEYKVLDSLYNEKGIPAELLNMLTYACLKSSPNISYRLANRILHDWLQHGVKDGAQAIEYMQKREQNKGKAPRYAQHKRVEKGTDWSKKKSTTNSDVSSADLKNFFKNFEDQNGMK